MKHHNRDAFLVYIWIKILKFNFNEEDHRIAAFYFISDICTN